jgi:predicted MPP superfamily phosphohydrolase
LIKKFKNLTISISNKSFMKNKFLGWQFHPDKIFISNLSIHLPRLPEKFYGYSIVQLSDFHLGTWLDGQDLVDIVNIVNQLEPDVIAVTGDFVNSDPERFAPILIQALSKLVAADAKVAVLGNHDHYTNARLIREVLENSSVVELRNRVLPIQRNDAYLYLAGIDDRLTGNDDLQRVINQLPDSNSPVILLAHEPDFADVSARTGRFDMQISGHTHGGQICLPFLGNLYLPRLGRKYPSGEYLVNDMVLYTNRGLGTSWLKLRYNCPPEISVFNLQSA